MLPSTSNACNIRHSRGEHENRMGPVAGMSLRWHKIWMARAAFSLLLYFGLARRHKRKRHGKLIGRRRAREMCDLIKRPPPRARARTGGG